jgi:hypothetical protein
MKTKTNLLLIIALVFITYNSCKKDEIVKRPKMVDTEEAKQEFIKMDLLKYSDNTISKFTSFVFAFAKPLDTEVISLSGNKIKYVKRTSSIQYDNKGTLTEVKGNWVLNPTKDTLQFFPNEALNDSFKVSINLEVVLHYSDDVFDVSKFLIKENLEVNKQFSTITPVSTNQLSPLTKTFEFGFIENLNKEIAVHDRKIKFELDELILNDTTYKRTINLNNEYLEDKKLKVNLIDPLKSNAIIQFKIKIKPSFLKDGVWEQFKMHGQPFYLTDTVTYCTTIFNLDSSSIEYSYPEDRQHNFLTRESFKGCVKLKVPFMLAKEPGLIYTARFNLLHGDSSDVDLKFIPDSNYFSFEIPQTLQKEKIYRLRFFASNNSTTYNFYDIYFRTSKYENFADKWSNVKCGLSPYLSGDLDYLCIVDEGFDYFDSQHIKLRALFENPDTKGYYADMDFLYSNMEKYGYNITWRKKEPYGVPPQYAVYLTNSRSNRLSDDEIRTGEFKTLSRSTIHYDAFGIYDKDLVNIQHQVMDKQSFSTTWENKILNRVGNGYPYIKYHCELKYILPNGSTIYTSEVVINKKDGYIFDEDIFKSLK